MKNLLISIKITLAFCVILGVSYVLVLWAVALIATPNSGEAVLTELNGKVVGAQSVGQEFSSDIYFWSRPSTVSYDGSGSGGSNMATTNQEHLKEVSARIDTFLMNHPYLERSAVPAEMVTASASGLDPHISVEAATVQLKRVAEARGVTEADLHRVMDSLTYKPFAGTATVNVLILNATLDEKYNN